MKYSIVGRTGTGKDTILKALVEAGLSPLKTHTDRPKRFPEEDSYYFHTKEETAAIPMKRKKLLTILDGDERFAMKEDLEAMDVCILDPSGFYEICDLFPNESIYLIHVTADANKARKMAGKRRTDSSEGIAIYDARYFDEDNQFTDFEEHVTAIQNEMIHPISKHGYAWPSNCIVIQKFHNPLDDLKIVKQLAKDIMIEHKIIKNAISLIDTAIALDCIKFSDGNPDKIPFQQNLNGVEQTKYVTREMLASILVGGSDHMTACMRSILRLAPISVENKTIVK